jgi:hypothetical protein
VRADVNAVHSGAGIGIGLPVNAFLLL